MGAWDRTRRTIIMENAILIVYKTKNDRYGIQFVQVGDRALLAEEYKKYMDRAELSEYQIGDKYCPLDL